MKRKIIATFEEVLSNYKSELHGIKALKPYTHWFPVYATPALGGIIADLMSDGHLQGKNKGRFDYTSNSVSELQRFNKEIFNIFRVNGKIRVCKTNKYGTMNLGVNNKPLSRLLEIVGVPAGAKVFLKYSIPDWIIHNKDIFGNFINRYFCAESVVDVHSKAIEIKMYKTEDQLHNGIRFFEQFKFWLEKYYDISTTKPFLEGKSSTRKDGIKTRGIRLKIKNKKSLMNFDKHIGLSNDKKTKKLKSIIKSYE